MYAFFVSGPDVEGVDGEIRRLREAIGKLAGQASPRSLIAMGGLRRRRSKREVPRSSGIAVIP
jgi:hypothetical protein